MGALHAGHVALIVEAQRVSDVVVVTIFVNPLQFDRSGDYNKYPRQIDDDLDACRAAGVDAVYAPTPDVMYAPEFQTYVEPGALAASLEGVGRPGHFRGVTTVVAKLFGAVKPDVAVFGRKDFQQLAIIRRMVADLDMDVEIVELATAREPDGLAISSRNQRLGADDREASVCVGQALRVVADAVADGETDVVQLIALATRRIVAEPRARLEYFDIIDPSTLEPVAIVKQPAIAVAAVWFGDVRLIDNVPLNP